jgi:hypothetical protein
MPWGNAAGHRKAHEGTFGSLCAKGLTDRKAVTVHTPSLVSREQGRCKQRDDENLKLTDCQTGCGERVPHVQQGRRTDDERGKQGRQHIRRDRPIDHCTPDEPQFSIGPDKEAPQTVHNSFSHTSLDRTGGGAGLPRSRSSYSALCASPLALLGAAPSGVRRHFASSWCGWRNRRRVPRLSGNYRPLSVSERTELIAAKRSLVDEFPTKEPSRR